MNSSLPVLLVRLGMMFSGATVSRSLRTPLSEFNARPYTALILP